MIQPVDVQFDLFHRRPGQDDVVLTTWSDHFEPLGGGVYDAQPYEHQAEIERVEYEPGDELIFKYTGTGTDTPMAWVPNGDGELLDGRIPYIDLPQ